MALGQHESLTPCPQHQHRVTLETAQVPPPSSSSPPGKVTLLLPKMFSHLASWTLTTPGSRCRNATCHSSLVPTAQSLNKTGVQPFKHTVLTKKSMFWAYSQASIAAGIKTVRCYWTLWKQVSGPLCWDCFAACIWFTCSKKYPVSVMKAVKNPFIFLDANVCVGATIIWVCLGSEQKISD